jgi:tetratricopeptide (TPR) repeat protein
LGQILSLHPIKEYQLIGEYYLGWCAYRNGIDVQSVFEKVLETSQTYKTKALWSLAAIESGKGNYEGELKYFAESLKYATDFSTRIDLVRAIAVVKSKEGFPRHALKDLENLIPYLRFAKPLTRTDCLNSLAFELCEAGRIEEAQNVCRIVLASPFVFAYPEWRETGDGIAIRGYKFRSSVRLKTVIPRNVLNFPEREFSDTSHTPIIKRSRGRVISLKKWKRKMEKEEDIDQMDFNELIVKLLQITACEEASEEKLRKVVKSAIEIMKD